MKPFLPYLSLFYFLFYVPLSAQQPQDFYRFENGNITITPRTTVTDTLLLVEQEKEGFVLDGTISMLMGILVPKLVGEVPKWFYHPEKYIKESFASQSFLMHDGTITKLEELHQIQFKKMAGTNPLAILNFTIDDVFLEQGYLNIALESAKINETGVKLKTQHHTLNVVVEVALHYYDAHQNKGVYAVEPFVLNTIATGPYHIPNDQKIRLIPKFELLQSIDIKVTEVNARKKDWDAYLSLYEENAGKLADYLLGLIKN